MSNTVPFNPPGLSKTCSTWYTVHGDLNSPRPRLVTVHGGPGVGHEYLLPFTRMWEDHGIPVILYDQIGCGQSTRLPEKEGDSEFWVEDLFIAELENLIRHLKLDDEQGPGFFLLGQSWGSTPVVKVAAKSPRGLKGIILASGVASGALAKKNYAAVMKTLAEDDQTAIRDAMEKDDPDDPAYQNAMMNMYRAHLYRGDDFPPQSLLPGQKHLGETKIHRTMIGRFIFKYDGTLSKVSSIQYLPEITVPALVYNGEFDSSTDIVTEPFASLLPQAKWIKITGGSHMCHLEAVCRDRVFEVVGEFLSEHAER